MAHEHKLEIFRGLLKFKSNTQKIWGVLVFLTIVTAVEVILGIYKPDFLMHTWISAFEGGFFATLGNIAFYLYEAIEFNIYYSYNR
jgi:hypothetical protein